MRIGLERPKSALAPAKSADSSGPAVPHGAVLSRSVSPPRSAVVRAAPSEPPPTATNRTQHWLKTVFANSRSGNGGRVEPSMFTMSTLNVLNAAHPVVAAGEVPAG